MSETGNYTIGTYNMSFMSDWGLDNQSKTFASETPMLGNATLLFNKEPIKEKGQFVDSHGYIAVFEKNEDGCVSTVGDKIDTKKVKYVPAVENGFRNAWKNSLEHLIYFIEEKKPLVVGLQEMNLTTDGDTGTKAVEKNLNDEKYTSCAKEIGETVKPALMIIWDKTVLGEVKKLGNNDCCAIVDKKINEKYLGRPLLMVLTDQNYLLLNTHGLQDPSKGKDASQFNEFNSTQIDWIEKEAEKFLNYNEIKELKGIFLTGDFNDRFDNIKKFNIFGKLLEQTGEAPRSCCYNHDSSCDPDGGKRTKPDKGGENDFYCNAPMLKSPLSVEDGKISSYVNRGDKVFSSFETKQMKIFPPKNGEKTSTRSDHELVYAEVKFIQEDTPDTPDTPSSEQPQLKLPTLSKPPNPLKTGGRRRRKNRSTKRSRRTQRRSKPRRRTHKH